jgi:hypothetical protein
MFRVLITHLQEQLLRIEAVGIKISEIKKYVETNLQFKKDLNESWGRK